MMYGTGMRYLGRWSIEPQLFGTAFGTLRRRVTDEELALEEHNLQWCDLKSTKNYTSHQQSLTCGPNILPYFLYAILENH